MRPREYSNRFPEDDVRDAPLLGHEDIEFPLVRVLLTEWRRMWVSRLSIPFEASAEEVVVGVGDHIRDDTDEVRAGRADGGQFRDGVTVFCDDDTVRRQMIEQDEAFLPDSLTFIWRCMP